MLKGMVHKEGVKRGYSQHQSFAKRFTRIIHDSCEYRRRTNVQQLSCKIDLSNYFYYLFFSFVLIELKPFVLKGKVPGEKL